MTVTVALGLDQTLREPPVAIHPTRLVGRTLELVARAVPAAPAALARRRGTVVWLAGAVAAVAAGSVGERLARASRVPALVRGVLLWPLLSRRLLLDEVAEVGPALARSLEAGRDRAGRLVSRDLSDADEAAVVDAAIGSLAENASDALVAPLWWFAVAGLPGAALYRFANTADACWGYRDARWHDAGRTAARADDLLNLVPARLTAAALAPRGVDRAVLRREAARTPSPNGGWPMAAVALALDVRIAKPGAYVLHAHAPRPTRDDLDRAVRWVAGRTWPAVAALAVAATLRTRLLRAGSPRTRPLRARSPRHGPGGSEAPCGR